MSLENLCVVSCSLGTGAHWALGTGHRSQVTGHRTQVTNRRSLVTASKLS